MGRYVYKMPDIGEGVVEAEITAWHVKLGDTVSEEDPIADAMTDKATIELTSPVDGVISHLGCEEGDILAVGAALTHIEVEGDVEGEDKEEDEEEDEAHSEPNLEATAKAAPKPESATPVSSLSTPVSLTETSGKVLASPAVRRRARESGLSLSDASPTGASGQVTHIDLDRLETALEAASKSAEGETRIKIIGLRRVIAERMQASKRHIPHFTYVEEIDVTALEALRARANENAAADKSAAKPKPKLTVLPFIIRALGLTLKDWPQFNARYMEEQGYVSQFSALNLGLAAMTDKGLIVPVIKDAGRKSIWQLARDISRLSEGARDNTLSPDDLTGASTTLTSLGPLGGIVTTPVINRPEVAIFGPNKIHAKVELRDGQAVERKVMNFSVSCDHRVIDGYDAAAMVQDLKALLEDPQMMFVM